MHPVTQEYKVAVYDPNRTITARVNFEILDVTASFDVSSISTPVPYSISQIDQLYNRVRNQTNNMITCEPSRVKLDGSFSFADLVTPTNNGETGFISDALCDGNGSFTTAQTFDVGFKDVHSSAAISLTFDGYNNEYATDFVVRGYNASGTLIETVTVTGNDQVVASAIGQFLNYKRIVVTVTKWSKPNRRLRLVEIDFGIIKVYDDNSLISANMIEELDVTSAQLPSPEFRFTVENVDRLFNILNPQGFYKYLQQRQRVTAELGVLTSNNQYEFVPWGTYILWEWTSEEGSLTATFTTRTNLDLMSNYFYEQLTPINRSLKALAELAFAKCGITNYSLDPSLANIMTNSLSERVDYKTLLQMIAIAGCCNIFVTRNNIITLKVMTVGNPVDELDFDNIYKEPKIELERIVRQVSVTYFSDLDTSAVHDAIVSGVDIGDTLELKENTLINTSQRAGVVASWILAQSQLRAKQTVNWRGNPAHELMDVVAIENSYGTNAKAVITKNELTYEGYLQGRLQAKGGVN